LHSRNVKRNLMENTKVQVSLLLDKEVVTWLEKEAKKYETTIDEVINDRLVALKLVHEFPEEKLGFLMTALKNRNNNIIN